MNSHTHAPVRPRWHAAAAALRHPALKVAAPLALLAATGVWGAVTGDIAGLRIASTVLMYIALAEGWNLLGGYAGYLNFGTVIFLGIGAYTTAIAVTGTGVNALVTIPLAALVAAGVSVLIGIPGFRLRGDYFAVATFVLTLAARELANVLEITGGSVGLFLPPVADSLGASTRLFFFLFLALAAVSVAICWVSERTRWFSALVAVREDEDAAEVLGVPTLRLKVVALAVGAAIAGAAGSLYAAQSLYIEPTGTFDFRVSLAVVVAVILGGKGTWYGPVAGAVLTQLLATQLFVRLQGVWDQLIFGLLLIAVALLAPRGITRLTRRARGRRFGV
ncbi:branched-chain amino acid transport system permease protein [Thermocatellispora tengchongensis]|uniref:Branched-chain amino acid transport system permease protein n=1 Tax=Thermocatellispora tengchongensis TaxID=1073253 RepID=A0A840PDG1_9ACTN|nr:branched-chain amino acid ABC transporter permease [Thermocatellispora tengchongensis]MBB5137252.1 branched-chain amino acid transport system permease protein [Thermocatellispora tengchongensis]